MGFPSVYNEPINHIGCNLTTLKYHLPSFSCDALYLSENPLTSLEGITPIINGVLVVERCPIRHLTNIHKMIRSVKHISFSGCPIKSNILGLMMIDNLDWVTGDSPVFKILYDHLQSDRDVLACQEEMILAGYKEFAKF